MDKISAGKFANKLLPLIRQSVATPQRKAISGAVVILLLFGVKKGLAVNNERIKDAKSGKLSKKEGKGNVDKEFFNKLLELIKICIPKLTSKIPVYFTSLLGLLVLRTLLSIWLAEVNGTIVKAIVQRDLYYFLQRIVVLMMFAFPSSAVNSYMDYFTKKIALEFRTNLTHYFHERYMKSMYYYKICNLDNRILNPDQRLTQDISKWADSLANLCLNLSKPTLDVFLFSRKLAELAGWQGPLSVFAYYFVYAIVIKLISPAFGLMTAIEQKLEGEYRSAHSRVQTYSEEIAFLKGHDWEDKKIKQTFNKLIDHSDEFMEKKMYMGVLDSILSKYGTTMVGYSVLGIPVFGAQSEEYKKQIGEDKSKITKDYIRNSSLLINLSKAIGRILVSYKDFQNLAGYTSLVSELKQVIDDLDEGKYNRALVKNADKTFDISDHTKRGEIILSGNIKFEDVPIISPNGDILVEGINFEVTKGMNLLISGPNGCGKSSLFRILGNLWPVFGGKVFKPESDKIFYIPQRPYLPNGTLRDQIIYPHTPKQMKELKGMTDSDLMDIMRICQCDNLVDREGWEGDQDWRDTLAGGEKQKIAMARLFYHKPEFAIMDECTSAVSFDIEAIMYNHSKELGITLITVTHRPSLWKYHEYLLKFDGSGNWSFEEMIHEADNK